MASLDLSGATVLVVDDHEDTADLFADILEYRGAIVHRATSLLDALGHLDHNSIQVIVTDLAMPAGSGWDLLEHVRQRRGFIPVVAVTAQVAPGGPWLISRGFAAVLYKPVDPGELVTVVAELARNPH